MYRGSIFPLCDENKDVKHSPQQCVVCRTLDSTKSRTKPLRFEPMLCSHCGDMDPNEDFSKKSTTNHPTFFFFPPSRHRRDRILPYLTVWKTVLLIKCCFPPLHCLPPFSERLELSQCLILRKIHFCPSLKNPTEERDLFPVHFENCFWSKVPTFSGRLNLLLCFYCLQNHKSPSPSSFLIHFWKRFLTYFPAFFVLSRLNNHIKSDSEKP